MLCQGIEGVVDEARILVLNMYNNVDQYKAEGATPMLQKLAQNKVGELKELTDSANKHTDMAYVAVCFAKPYLDKHM